MAAEKGRAGSGSGPKPAVYPYLHIDLARFFGLLKGTLPWKPILGQNLGIWVYAERRSETIIISPFRFKNA